MKSFFKARFAPLVGIIVFIAVIGFSMMGCGGEEDEPIYTPIYTPITQIPDNYLNTTWSYSSGLRVTFGSDASKFYFYQSNLGTSTITNFSPCTKEEIKEGFDSGLNPAGKTIVCFKNDGSKLCYANITNWTKQ